MTTTPPPSDATAAHPPKKHARSARRRAREFALQGIYQWLLSDNEAGLIDAQMRGMEGFKKADTAHYDTLLHGCIDEAALLDAMIAPHVDRKTAELSPVEHGILLLGAYELSHFQDIPYRVVINEAVELAKTFGGTDGFKYVNGVLDKVAFDQRAVEIQAAQAAHTPPALE